MSLDDLQAQLRGALDQQFANLKQHYEQALTDVRRQASVDAERDSVARLQAARAEWESALASIIETTRAETRQQADEAARAQRNALEHELQQQLEQSVQHAMNSVRKTSELEIEALRRRVEQDVQAEKQRGEKALQAAVDLERGRAQEALETERQRVQQETERAKQEADAERQRAQQEVEHAKQEAESEHQRALQEFQGERQRSQQEAEGDRHRLHQEFQAERERLQQELDGERQRLQQELDGERQQRQQLGGERERLQQELEAERGRAQALESARERAQQDLEAERSRAKAELETVQQLLEADIASAQADAAVAREASAQAAAEAETAAARAAAADAAAAVHASEAANARAAAAAMPAVAPTSAAVARVPDAVRALDAARSLSQTLETLLQQAAAISGRAALFLIDGDRLKSWKTAGIPEIDVQTVESSIGGRDLLARAIQMGQSMTASPDMPAPPFARMSPDRPAVAIPLMVAGRAVAVLYADPGAGDPPAGWMDGVELVTRHASAVAALRAATRTLDVLRGDSADPSAGNGHGNGNDEESARRYARLLVSEIKLYNEAAVRAGRQQRDLRQRLRAEIDRAQRLYEERVPPAVGARDQYFRQELVQTLADGDPALLGS